MRNGLSKIKIWLNQGIGKIAPLTHFIPEKTRHAVADRLIRATTPKRITRVHPPVREGRIPYPPGINEYGLFRATIGLSQGAKLYARALEKTGIPLSLVSISFAPMHPDTDHSYDRALSRGGKYAVNLIHVNAPSMEGAFTAFPRRLFDNHYNIGVWLWELETLPASWREALPFVDELWVPSRFIAGAVQKETDKPVTVIPYGIETPTAPCGRADFGFPEGTFLALAMYDSYSYASRKNPEGAIAAFEQAFGGRAEDAALVLKVANGKPEELRALRERLDRSGIRYFLVTERLEKPKLNAMIACCDVFMSLHRSEGFGLVVAEAMNLAVPVIATGWSANAEFMPPECTCRVGYTMVPVGDAYQAEGEPQVWAEPDVAEAARFLRRLKDQPAEARRMALAAQEYLRREYSIEKCAEKMRKRYDEICRRLRKDGAL
ncbi:MAG: glycosyltransferase family 4 protein [Clostridia bacterium]|nr:glycosyltransferase family 4 protein [Clostridia bacterium]